jgi:hypothetical protein
MTAAPLSHTTRRQLENGADAMSIAEHRFQQRPARITERWEFHALVFVTYPLFLAVTLLSRVMPRRFRFMPTGAGGRMSVFAEARAAAHTTLPFAFMG